jgi:hypothetical protein
VPRMRISIGLTTSTLDAVYALVSGAAPSVDGVSIQAQAITPVDRLVDCCGAWTLHTPVAAVWSRSACEQLIQLRELFGQGFRRTGEGFVEGRRCGVEFV